MLRIKAIIISLSIIVAVGLIYLVYNLTHFSKKSNSTVEKKCPARVASLLVGLDQILYAVAPEKVVGVSYLSADPSISLIANKIQNITLLKVDTETILKLRPDLLLISRFSNTNFINVLVEHGIKVHLFDKFNNLGDIENNIKIISDITCSFERGEKLLKWINNLKKRLKKECKKKSQKPTALYISSTLSSAGADTIISDIIELACLTNILKQKGIKNFHQLKLEEILIFNPDFLIFDEYVDVDAFFQRYNVLQRLNAFKNKKIVQIESKYLVSTSHYDFLAAWILFNKIYRPSSINR